MRLLLILSFILLGAIGCTKAPKYDGLCITPDGYALQFASAAVEPIGGGLIKVSVAGKPSLLLSADRCAFVESFK